TKIIFVHEEEVDFEVVEDKTEEAVLQFDCYIYFSNTSFSTSFCGVENLAMFFVVWEQTNAQKNVARFHDTSNEVLNNEVLLLNPDHPGFVCFFFFLAPNKKKTYTSYLYIYNYDRTKAHQSIKETFIFIIVMTKESPRIKINKLIKLNLFFLTTRLCKVFADSTKKKKKNVSVNVQLFKKKPKELANSRPVKTEYRPYTAPYATRPKHWPTDVATITLKTNSFEVRGKLLETQVFQFEVAFDPPIDAEQVTFREKVILGSNVYVFFFFWKKKKKEVAFTKRNTYLFINLKKKKKNTSSFGWLDTAKRETMKFWGNYLASIPLQQQEALLNIFNRKRLQAAGFSRIGRGWFKKGNTDHDRTCEILVPSTSQSAKDPEINIVKNNNNDNNNNNNNNSGFDCSIHILPSRGGQQTTVFKADVAHRLVERST
ncbi:hypothetical protein RFI_15436, partial [Reticulomyxa filosa]